MRAAPAFVLIAACAPARPPSDRSDAPAPATASVAPVAPPWPARADASAVSDPPTSPLQGPCPDGMKLVDTMHCPEVRRTCLDDEYSKSNKITICHRFAAEPPKCLQTERRQRFCIDELEFPNRRGARSPVMVDFYDAMSACAEQGKRLCWENEWTAACEGPDKLPFPYGYARSKEACNIENPWIKPSLKKLYDTNPAVSGAELSRLDQGVASGAKEGCVSGFGVRDLTGNVDEWVMLEKKRGEGGWAGLKGGAWGHVRNACRPVTTSHAPEFTYYFISFRCCADAKADPEAEGKPAVWRPPPLPPNKKGPGTASKGWTPPSR